MDMKMLKAFYVTAHAEDKFSIQNPVYANYLNSLVEEFNALQAGGNSFTDESSSSEGSQTLSRANFLHLAVGVIKRLKEKHDEMSELTFLLLDEKDPEMKKMMEAELNLYRNDLREMEEELVDVLVGDDPADNSDIMLEVTAGVGGQEAMLFCQEVFNMYCNYAVRKGWRLAEVTSDTSEQGGSRKASVEISGDGVYRQLKHEGGVHRVQRVPRTEKAGRIHTSTITVSVMPQPKEIDIEIQQKDLKIETFRNSGPGGQSVNTTDSAVRITHIPTGTVAEGREERSQIKNRDIAMKKLKQRIYEAILNEQQAEIRASRTLQQGTRARSEKIRTYNFQQDRVTDHRTRESTSNLSHLLAVGGEGLDGLIDNLIQLDRYQTLEMMLEGSFLEAAILFCMEHLVTTGKFEGKRSRGRQREKIMDGLATWLGPGKVSDTLAAVKDRDLWRDMIANAYKQGT
ncbi:peptide chain release factor 1 [Plakobranchus ocellatus]|uniref:Peptide chain release factor 1 n=1 Tax=Plakobranchus ocellatus TaxID=259542 RepID=A0AAV3ZXK3_9GAST|nr:peptide chain release factor 1 [Plakobranchus ocellatus]